MWNIAYWTKENKEIKLMHNHTIQIKYKYAGFPCHTSTKKGLQRSDKDFFLQVLELIRVFQRSLKISGETLKNYMASTEIINRILKDFDKNLCASLKEFHQLKE